MWARSKNGGWRRRLIPVKASTSCSPSSSEAIVALVEEICVLTEEHDAAASLCELADARSEDASFDFLAAKAERSGSSEDQIVLQAEQKEPQVVTKSRRSRWSRRSRRGRSSSPRAIYEGVYAVRGRSRPREREVVRLRLLHSSMTGTWQHHAEALAEEFEALAEMAKEEAVLQISIEELSADNLLIRSSQVNSDIVAILLSCDRASWRFGQRLQEHAEDFSVNRFALKHLTFAVVAFGTAFEAASAADAALAGLGAKRQARLALVPDTEAPEVSCWDDALRMALQEGICRQP